MSGGGLSGRGAAALEACSSGGGLASKRCEAAQKVQHEPSKGCGPRRERDKQKGTAVEPR